MRTNRGIAPWVLAASLGLALTGCSDDGAEVRRAPGPGSPSGPGSGSHPPAAGGGGQQVPTGVAEQYATVRKEIRAEGGETRSGPWRVGYIVEPAEAWFEPNGQFRQPAAGETHHIEIVPFESASGRIVPGVPIRLEILDAGGQVVEAKELNFYYSEFFHYANNFSVPTAGSYTLRATLAPPTFFRHGEQAEGPALAEGATVEFTGVELVPGG